MHFPIFQVDAFTDKLFGGNSAAVCPLEHWLSDEVMQRISDDFTVKTPRLIKKLDLNKIDQEDLVTIQHIDYKLASEIIEQRILHDGFTELTELKKIKGFPQDRYEIIALYLYIQK